MDPRVGLGISDKKIIPRKTEQNEQMVISDGIPAVPRNRKPRNSVPNPSVEEKTTIEAVSFLWNFFISREAASAERRYEKERQSGSYVHMAAFSARTYLLSLSPPCPPPPPLITGSRPALYFRPPLPPHPHEDCSQLLATSPNVEDGLHLGACEYGS